MEGGESGVRSWKVMEGHEMWWKMVGGGSGWRWWEVLGVDGR